MTKGPGIWERDGKMGGGNRDPINSKKKMKRNVQRLGGTGGLSLESFANAKTRNDSYNPALIKKKREFYKNAKYMKKYKQSLKQQEQQHIPPSTAKRPLERGNQMKERDVIKQNKKRKKNMQQSLGEIYEKKREEEEKARQEREAMIQAKKEARQEAEAQRKSLKEKMFKRTKSGQPVMKYRIEHLLETIQAPTNLCI